MLTLAGLMVVAYLVGSVNFAILVLRLTGRGDPREQFSKNAGTSNVYRIAGLFWAAVVLILDMTRAIGIAILATWLLSPDRIAWVGAGLVAGNIYPCFHGFHGGKGVANFLGFTLLIAPLWSIAALAVWVFVYLASKRPFLGSLAMVILLCVGQIRVSGHVFGWIGAVITIVMIIRAHRSNITELFS